MKALSTGRVPAAGAIAIATLFTAGCASIAPVTDAASLNRKGLYATPIDLFGREEAGWAVYAPRVAESVGAGAARPDTPAFAHAVARWQARHRLPATGVVDGPTLAALKGRWQDARPFFKRRLAGVCPAPPSPEQLASVPVVDSLGGRPLQLRPGALAAYERMVAAARRDEPTLAARPELLTLFSAYRSPERDAARCRTEGDCQGVVRAACSAHRTGLALDLMLDGAPGRPVDSSADADRRAMTQGVAYRWLVVGAARFGFVNYAFEPWHWEWTGEAP